MRALCGAARCESISDVERIIKAGGTEKLFGMEWLDYFRTFHSNITRWLTAEILRLIKNMSAKCWTLGDEKLHNRKWESFFGGEENGDKEWDEWFMANLIEWNLNGISDRNSFSATALLHLNFASISCYLKLSVYLSLSFFVAVGILFSWSFIVFVDSLYQRFYESSYFLMSGLSANKLNTFPISLVGFAFSLHFYWCFVGFITTWGTVDEWCWDKF